MSDRFDVVVVGSGAGGGVVAGELAQRGRNVLLLERGGHYTAIDFTRFEAKANHTFWSPVQFCDTGAAPVALLSASCVGGTTVVNTKVALRAHEKDLAKWHAATGLTSDDGRPFGPSDLAPYYDRVEQHLGVRERNDWTKSVYTVKRGFDALGAELESVHAYADVNCMRCGSCLQGCPTNAGKSTQNTYIHEAWVPGSARAAANAHVERVVVSGGEATGVEYVDARCCAARRRCGRSRRRGRRAEYAAAPPAVGPFVAGDREASRVASGAARVRLVRRAAGRAQGLSDHDACMDHQLDENGGYVIEATTIQDPIAFATTLCDENGALWGQPLVDAVKQYRNYVGVLAMVNDENNATVDDGDRFAVTFTSPRRSASRTRCSSAATCCFWPGRSASSGAGSPRPTGRGSARMGDDPAVSVVDRNCETHEVKRLYVGDGSLVPRTLSVNPSLTIMALATRLADRLAA